MDDDILDLTEMDMIMDKPKYKMGDVVWLNSGSPALTVTYVFRNEPANRYDVTFTYLDDVGFFRNSSLPEACLRNTNPKKKN